MASSMETLPGCFLVSAFVMASCNISFFDLQECFVLVQSMLDVSVIIRDSMQALSGWKSDVPKAM